MPLQSQSTCRGDCSIQVMMTEELTKKVVVWATEIASCAAELPSSRARDAYLAERRVASQAVAEGAAERDAAILADACVGAARSDHDRIVGAPRAGVPRAGRRGGPEVHICATRMDRASRRALRALDP